MLIVDDDPDIRMLVRVSFSKDSRFELDGEVADMVSALTLIEAAPPDLVVLDHRIEGELMGLQAAPLIKKAAPECRIILSSRPARNCGIRLWPSLP